MRALPILLLALGCEGRSISELRLSLDESSEEVQAKRETRKRPAWDFDTELFSNLKRAFPYVDTVDQAKAEWIVSDRSLARGTRRVDDVTIAASDCTP